MPEQVAEPDQPPSPFQSLGVRVPALVVSPWVERGAVSKTPFDHTSLIKTILTRFCERDQPAPFVSARVDATNHLGHVLTADSPRFIRRFLGNGAATPGLLRAGRDTTLSKLGKRLLADEARPRTPRPPTDLEQDMAEVRAFVATSAKPTKRPLRP